MTHPMEVQVGHQFDTQLWEKIQGLDLVRVRNRLIIKEGYTADDADATIAEYRQYLYIAGKIGNVAPGADCDDAWHAHMLHLPMYFRDCLHLYGRILWHVPNETTEEEVALALETPRRKKNATRKLAVAGACGGCFCAAEGDCTPSTNCQNVTGEVKLAVCDAHEPGECKNSCYEGMTPFAGTDCEAIQASMKSHLSAHITVPKNEYASREGVEIKSFYQVREEIFG